MTRGDNDFEERRKPPTFLLQVAVGVLGTAIAAGFGSGIITWAGHRELVGDVNAHVEFSNREVARIEARFNEIVRELNTNDEDWHACAERMARLEQIIEFLMIPGSDSINSHNRKIDK